MRIGVIKEITAGEARVAATPETAKKFIGLGYQVTVQAGSGIAASNPDALYTAVGAQMVATAAEALKDADFVYVKNWSTYADYGKIYESDPKWMLTNKKLEGTNNAKVMHCLPVRRNVELSDEILDGPSSIVTREAGNRVWAAQAVLEQLLITNG